MIIVLQGRGDTHHGSQHDTGGPRSADCGGPRATLADPEMQKMIEFIMNGCPTSKSAVPQEICCYFDIQDTLSYEDDVILAWHDTRSATNGGGL